MKHPVEITVTGALGGSEATVGTLHPHPHGGATFRYDDAWIAHPATYSISPRLRLVTGTQHLSAPERGRLPQAFTDSAPDRWGRNVIRHEWRRRGHGVPSEVDYLLGVNDRLRMGGLRYWVDGIVQEAESRVPKLLDIAQLESAARRAEMDEEVAHDIELLFQAGSSLGGARPKATVEDENGRLLMAKFSSPKDATTVVAWEKVCLDIAERSGITTPESRLMRIGDRAVLLLDRFDRRYDTGAEVRVPYMSAMTLLDRTDGDTSSMVSIAEEYEAQPRPRGDVALAELWTRAALNLLIGNTDNHLRNHGFLWTDGGWELSPVFDVTPATDKSNFAVSVDEGRDDTLTTLLDVSELFGLDRPDALGTLARVVDAVDQWRDIARRHGIPPREDRRVEDGFAGRLREEAAQIL